MTNILSIPLLVAALSVSGADTPAEFMGPASNPAAARIDGAPAAPGRRELSVLTYNVRGLPWPIARNRKAALAEIGRRLAELRREGRAPDVVLIQEGFEDVSELVRLSGYRYWVSGPGKGEAAHNAPTDGFVRGRYPLVGEGWGKLTGAGLHILSDLPLTEVETEAYRACAGFDCLANKGVMMARIAAPDLPAPLEIVNTHLNSREAAKAPRGRSLRAHHLQMETFRRFVARSRTPGAALVIGGDFNVKDDPARYDYKAASRPFAVVSEYCSRDPAACGEPATVDRPWLASQDLQAFASDGRVRVRPLSSETLFDGADLPRLSDHDAYLVRYELSWG